MDVTLQGTVQGDNLTELREKARVAVNDFFGSQVAHFDLDVTALPVKPENLNAYEATYTAIQADPPRVLPRRNPSGVS